MVHRASILCCFIVATFVVAGSALAQDPVDECEDPIFRTPLEVTPAVGVSNVTLGAPIKVLYPPGYFEDPVIGADPATSIIVLEEDESGPVVPGYSRAIGDTLVFTPDAPFRASSRYVGTAFGLDADFQFNFRTGLSYDTAPPVLGPILSLAATRNEDDTCDAPAGTYRIDVAFGPATDDGPLGDMEYLLYMSRGPELEEPQLRSRVRHQSTGDQIMAFVAEGTEVAAPICVTVVAVDGVGNIDDSAEPFCDDPIKGSFFEPLCSATPGRGHDGGAPLGVLAGLGLAGLFGVRRRARRRR